MAVGSTIIIAEAKLQPGGIVWRVASGRGWESLGGQRVLCGGAFTDPAGGDYTDRAIDDCAAAIRCCIDELDKCAGYADHTQALSVGSLGELHRRVARRA